MRALTGLCGRPDRRRRRLLRTAALLLVALLLVSVPWLWTTISARGHAYDVDGPRSPMS
ncbi:hypothetical protein [Micromonospora globbae]|uniref:hypothetical protein n=1 Tax=Micromonospora globbae TaxID=1894969 RepID=UPI001EFFF806|nr:hypothetical protein [Micromonospora globbae]